MHTSGRASVDASNPTADFRFEIGSDHADPGTNIASGLDDTRLEQRELGVVPPRPHTSTYGKHQRSLNTFHFT
jgi:hypothetical protein